MTKTEIYINEHRARFLNELSEFISIPSISSDTLKKAEMHHAAKFLKETLIKAGVDFAEIHNCTPNGNPIVYAQRIIDPSYKTILVYGHYDVMPVEPISKWETDPFKAEIKNGAIWARGANDDKGQSFTQIKSFEAMNKTGELTCNVKFMFEGEEEIGSESLSIWCRNNKSKLKSDVILLSDTSMIGENTPSVTCGLRGITYFDVKVTGPNRDLHSGLYGGAVANPINILASMISKLTDDNGRITVPGFYDDVCSFSDKFRETINLAPFNEGEYKKAIDVDELFGEKGYTTIERKGIRPTMDVCGIQGGYTGEGSKTIIPSYASAKISLRLVANQKHSTISDNFINYFRSLAPKSVKVDITPLHGGDPYMADTESPEYKAAAHAISDVFEKEPIPFYSGGSIPIITTFEKELGIKSILLGFGLDSDSIHGPNENFRLTMFDKALKTIPLFYKYYSK